MSRNSNASVEDVFDATFAGLFAVLPYADALLAVRVVYEGHELDRGVRVVRRLGRPVGGSAAVAAGSGAAGGASSGDVVVAVGKPGHCPAPSHVPSPQHQPPSAAVLAESEARLRHFHPKRSNMRPVQSHGANTAWMVFKLRGDLGLQGRVYVVCLEQGRVAIPAPDLEFLETVQKIVQRALQVRA